MAHEALIRAWPRLHRWLTDDRTTLVVHRRLTEATQTWEQLDRDDGALYRGAQLVAAQAWVQDHPGEPNRVEATFLAASTALAEAAAVHDRRRARLFQRLVAAVSVLLVLALVGGVFAVAQRQSARRQQVDSLAAELALRSRSLLPTDPDLAGLLAVEAARLHPDPETQGAVLSVAAAPARVQFNVDGPAITAVAFSPDHTRLAAATADGTVGLWAPAAGRRATVLSGLKGRATAVAYSADGTEVAAAGGGLIMAWDARTGALEHQVAEPNMHSAMALSADGGTVAASVGAGDIVLRDLSTGGRRVLHADPTWFTSLSFSADGRLLAAASGVADPLVWNVGPGTLRERLSAPHAYTVDFAPTGTVLAASADDRGVYLWDLGGPATVRLPDLPLQGGYGWSISPPTAGTLAVGDEAGGVTIWDIARRRRIEAFTDRGRSETASVTISPDGALMASAGFNGSIIVHDLHHTPFAGFDAGVTDVKVSPDGSVIATGGTDGAVRLWTPAGALVATLDGAPDQLAAVAFSPDGRLLAAVTRNMTIAIWDVHTHQPVLPTIRPDTLGASTDVVFNPAGTMLGVATLGPNLWDVHDPAHPVDLSSTMEVHLATTMAFTPDGRRLIGASVSGLIFTWDITTGKVVSRVDSHQGALQDLAQSPDGRLLATAGDSRTITLWDTATMKPIAELSGHTAPVQVLAFSRDGRTLASAGDDHAVLVWDVASRQLTATLTGHSARIRGLAFTPAGILVSGAEDGRIISWDLDPARSAARICARVGRNLTANEWAANLGSQAYDKTCP